MSADCALSFEISLPSGIVLTPQARLLVVTSDALSLSQLLRVLSIVTSIAGNLVGKLKKFLFGVKRLEVRRFLQFCQELSLLNHICEDLVAFFSRCARCLFQVFYWFIVLFTLYV